MFYYFYKTFVDTRTYISDKPIFESGSDKIILIRFYEQEYVYEILPVNYDLP